MVRNSKATRREETSVYISSRKGLENAACRITGYGNSETCVTAVTLISHGPGAGSSKVPIINGHGKLSPFTLKIEVSIVLHLA